jgi:hypothetical protein
MTNPKPKGEQSLTMDDHYIMRTFEFATENWQEDAARFMH